MPFVLRLLQFVVLLSLCSCGIGIKQNLTDTPTRPLTEKDELITINELDEPPTGSEYLGEVKIQGRGVGFNCGYKEVLLGAEVTARHRGANILHVTSVRRPDVLESCYHLEARLYRNTDDAVLADFKNTLAAKNQSSLPAGAKYALIHFYRPRHFQGSAVGFGVRDETDKIIGRLRNNRNFTYRTEQFGERFFFVNGTSLPFAIDVESGGEYFFELTFTQTGIVNRPVLHRVDNLLASTRMEKTKVLK